MRTTYALTTALLLAAFVAVTASLVGCVRTLSPVEAVARPCQECADQGKTCKLCTDGNDLCCCRHPGHVCTCVEPTPEGK